MVRGIGEEGHSPIMNKHALAHLGAGSHCCPVGIANSDVDV
jgi:hypothetical protein